MFRLTRTKRVRMAAACGSSNENRPAENVGCEMLRYDYVTCRKLVSRYILGYGMMHRTMMRTSKMRAFFVHTSFCARGYSSFAPYHVATQSPSGGSVVGYQFKNRLHTPDALIRKA